MKEIEILTGKRLPVEPEPYVFYPIQADALRFANISTAWKMEFTPRDDPAWVQIYNQLPQYNAYLKILDETPGFEKFFAENGYCLSRQQICDRYGESYANQVFSLTPYPFHTGLIIQGEYLLDLDFAPRYRVSIPEFGEVHFTVDELYAISSTNRNISNILLWNWAEDDRDFAYGLYNQFGTLGLLPAKTDDSAKSYANYDCYDQHRENMTEPDRNLLRCMELLENMEYFIRYKVVPQIPSPWFPHREGAYGMVAALDYRFKQDTLLMEKLRLILAQSEEEVITHRYFLTDATGKQYLSDTPGKMGGHKKLKIYGRLDCPSANRHIANGDYVRHRVFFVDEATAIAAGYRPCAVCMREQYTEWKLQK